MVTEKIITLLAENYDLDESTLTADSSFEEMAFDSLDVAEMVMTLEDEFGVSIEMSAEITTIRLLAKHIESRMD